jgi:hypothetical protein
VTSSAWLLHAGNLWHFKGFAKLAALADLPQAYQKNSLLANFQ